MNEASNRLTSMPGFPMLYPDAGCVNPSYYAYEVMEAVKPPFWDGTNLNLPPTFGWGGRIGAAPPQQRYPGWLNINRTQDVAISLTKVMGRHTFKGGFYNNHSFKAQNVGAGGIAEPDVPGIRELRQRREQRARHAASAMPTRRPASSRSTCRPRTSSRAA